MTRTNFTKCAEEPEKVPFSGLVTGHDFSRADKANKMNGALAPADALSAKSLEIEPFSVACSGR